MPAPTRTRLNVPLRGTLDALGTNQTITLRNNESDTLPQPKTAQPREGAFSVSSTLPKPQNCRHSAFFGSPTRRALAPAWTNRGPLSESDKDNSKKPRALPTVHRRDTHHGKDAHPSINQQGQNATGNRVELPHRIPKTSNPKLSSAPSRGRPQAYALYPPAASASAATALSPLRRPRLRPRHLLAPTLVPSFLLVPYPRPF